MYANELENLLKKFPNIYKYFKGIYAIDKVPRKLKELEYIIVNTE